MAEDIRPDCHSELRLDGSCPMCDPEGRIPWDDDETRTAAGRSTKHTATHSGIMPMTTRMPVPNIPLVSAEERKKLRDKHYTIEISSGPRCCDCLVVGPCPVLRLLDMLEAAEKDATRYRILRSADNYSIELFEPGESEFESFLKQGRVLDSTLDSAIKRLQEPPVEPQGWDGIK